MAYSPLRHLFSAIWLNHDPRRKHVVMITGYTAYFDATGDPHSEYLFVSGFVSSAEKWLRFEEGWNALLAAYGITSPFHMTDFANGAGQYASWKRDEAKRTAFMKEAHKLLKLNVNKSLSAGLNVKTFYKIQSEYKNPPEDHTASSPYTICAFNIATLAKQWLEKHREKRGAGGDTLEFVYERGDREQGRFIKEWERMYPKDPLPIFRDKATCVPLQAADMLAWEHQRAVKDMHKRAVPRRSYASLWLHMPQEWMFMGEDILRGAHELRQTPKRDQPSSL